MLLRACLGWILLLVIACQRQAPPTEKEQLAAFMRQHWGPLVQADAGPIALAAVHRARRDALGAGYPRRMLVIPAGHLKYRVNDTPFAFRPANAFYYLTGSTEPDSVLVLAPVEHPSRTHEAVLFAAPTFDPNDARFYEDARDGALWVGPRPSFAATVQRLGVDQVLPLSALRDYLQEARGLWGPKAILLRGIDAEADRAVPADADNEAALARSLARLRLIKDAHELSALRRACESTRAAFHRAVQAMQHVQGEKTLDVAFTTVARTLGNGPGYLPIVAAGPHATILHWRHNDGPMPPGELLLMDAGVEDVALYTSDITRTFPISGKFTDAQRRIYDLVYEAQQAAYATIRPGVPWVDVGKAATQVLQKGLVQMHLLQDANSPVPLHRRYTLHGISHMLGLDVHDCGEAGKELLGDGTLQPGMVFTVEPGLYFQPNDLTVPKALRGVGVRIEDDVVVTASGYERLCEIPADAVAVEAWIKAAWAGDDATRVVPDSAKQTE